MYDLSKKYEDTVLPLVQEVQKVCYKLNIPFFMTFAVADDGRKTEFVSEIYDEVAAGIPLTQDYINKMACVLRGFIVVPNESYLPTEDLEEAFSTMKDTKEE